MGEQENKRELRGKLIRARDIEEVRAILGPETAEEEIDQVWQEIEAHRPADGLEAVDDDELDAVSGGADRDLDKDGCSASVEEGSWCGSDDYCKWFDVTYSHADWCTDGYRHDWKLVDRWVLKNYTFSGLKIGERQFYKCSKCDKKKQVDTV